MGISLNLFFVCLPTRYEREPNKSLHYQVEKAHSSLAEDHLRSHVILKHWEDLLNDLDHEMRGDSELELLGQEFRGKYFFWDRN